MVDEMKKIIFALCFVIMVTMSSCSFSPSPPPTSGNRDPQETIIEVAPCKVVSIEKKQWFAACWHFSVEIELYCEKYDFTDTIIEKDGGMFGRPNAWELEEGDEVFVQMRRLVHKKSGKVDGQYMSHIRYFYN